MSKQVASSNNEASKLEEAKFQLSALESRMRRINLSMRPAWSMPMSEVLVLKANGEREAKIVAKEIEKTKEEILRLERLTHQ